MKRVTYLSIFLGLITWGVSKTYGVVMETLHLHKDIIFKRSPIVYRCTRCLRERKQE